MQIAISVLLLLKNSIGRSKPLPYRFLFDYHKPLIRFNLNDTSYDKAIRLKPYKVGEGLAPPVFLQCAFTLALPRAYIDNRKDTRQMRVSFPKYNPFIYGETCEI